jgi:hypothetical protein
MAQAMDASLLVLPAVDGLDTPSLRTAFPAALVLDSMLEIDILALVAGARLVVTDLGPAATVALAFRRPVLALDGDREVHDLSGWVGDPDLVADSPADLLSRAELATARSDHLAVMPRLCSAVELAYDELAAAVTGCAARRLSMATPEILVALQGRIGDLERANMALQARMVSEREALAAYATSQPTPRVLQSEVLVTTERALDAEERAASAERWAEQANRELEAVLATKTMRLLTPVRRVYGRLRGLP